MNRNKHLIVAGVLFSTMLFPSVKLLLEQSMVGQMLIQIPLLIFSGYYFGIYLRDRNIYFLEDYNQNGIPGILVAIFASLYWMLPVVIDSSIDNILYEILKYVTVPLFIGYPIAMSWQRLSMVAKGFILANAASMFFVMGWLYQNTNIRLCSNYLISQQQLLGAILFYGSIGLFILLAIIAFIGPGEIVNEKAQPHI